MKAMLENIICFCVALLPLMTQCIQNHAATKRLLDKMAIKGTNISKIFRPSVNGSLGQGMSGLTYKGTLLTIDKEVAMKFISAEFENYAKNEHQAYKTLGAVNNTEKEVYGIPTLYHFGRWKNYFVLAITLLDSEFERRWKNCELTTMNKLIVFREMVRITKYIHSRGICHGDTRIDNIMFRRNQGFIIDYNLAIDVKMNAKVVITCASRDWRKFLSDIAKTVEIEIDWSSFINPVHKFDQITHEGLKRVFRAFTATIYEDRILEYNKVYGVIQEEIDRLKKHVVPIVSWMQHELVEEKFSNLSLDEVPSIESIKFFNYSV
ncbi:uncharacterized protein LOC116348350 [Contarinia nasturtii]|uniref:uncharacterized protein LOC116348350 n=1 Tax=Contarinia nasturtii TaxID=265458 RepID=UPI0012D48248|nr:uncharacterized protein LOC116348350 [Contarinia nasturtii]